MLATSDLIERDEKAAMLSTFREELHRIAVAMHVFEIRYHLSIYPKDLCRHWVSVEGGWPPATSRPIARTHGP